MWKLIRLKLDISKFLCTPYVWHFSISYAVARNAFVTCRLNPGLTANEDEALQSTTQTSDWHPTLADCSQDDFRSDPIRKGFKMTISVRGSFNKTKCSVCGEYVFDRYVRMKDGKSVCIPCSEYEKTVLIER